MNFYIYELPKCLLTWENAQCIDHAVRKCHAVKIVIAGIIENFELQTIVHHNISHLQVCIIIQHCNMQNRAMVHWSCSLKVDLKTCSCDNRDACFCNTLETRRNTLQKYSETLQQNTTADLASGLHSAICRNL